MTRKKAGHNLPSQGSAKTSTHEATPATEDGPEGYTDDGPIKQSEVGKTKVPHAESTNTSSKSKAENYQKHKPVTGSSESGRTTILDPPQVTSEILALKSSRYGSPFAYQSYQNKHDFFKGLLVDSTCMLFDQVVAEASSLRERLLENLPLANNGHNGHFCALKKRNPPSVNSDSSEESENEDSKVRLYCFKPNNDGLRLSVSVDFTSAATRTTGIDLVNSIDSISGTASGNFKADTIISVCRIQSSTTGKMEYFIVNSSFGLLRINGIDVKPTVVAGPLPDFAVLELANFSFFWWRTANALDYMPSLKRKRDYDDSNENAARKVAKGGADSSSDPQASGLQSSHSGSQASSSGSGSGSGSGAGSGSGSGEQASGEQAPGSGPQASDSGSQASGSQASDSRVSDLQASDLQVFPDSKNWLEEYRRRFQLCEERPIRYTSSITALHPPHQYPTGEMHYTDVILAIGAVWLGLKDAKVDFAYANSDFFSFARSMRMIGMHAVNRNDHFLMPLLFNRELQNLSPEQEEDTAEPLEPVFSEFQRGEEEKYKENFAAAEKAKQRDPGNKNNAPPSLEDQEVQNINHLGGIGHFILAIAEKVNRDESSTIKDALAKKALVRLRIMDSANGFLSKKLIRRVARNTVRNSGWLGDIWPYFDANEEDWMDVLGQSGNRCGEHTVLNAWAYMLKIPVATTRERALGVPNYNEIRKMILLALCGQLDSLTIRAWMQHSKYAVDEPLSQLQKTQTQNPSLVSNLRNMQTVALNEDAFNEIVSDMYTHDQTINREGATILGTVPRVPDAAVTERSGHAPHVATELLMPPSIQAPDHLPRKNIFYQSPRTWRESLMRGLIANKALRASKPRTTQEAWKNASIIKNPSNLADYDVILGIAPIWEGLKRLGRPDMDFTFAGIDVSLPEIVSSPERQPQICTVGTWSRFIMPLFFPPVGDKGLENPGEGKGKTDNVGHLMLCVAELVNDQPMTVQLTTYDSSPSTVPIESIRPKAEKIINKSGWLGPNHSAAQVVYRPCIRCLTPVQAGFNTCGLFTIFNAWAVMLDIPIHPSPWRRGRTSKNLNDDNDRGFCTLGLRIVNAALEGFMDSATIQAFFNAYGYSVEQRFGDPARAVVPVNAVGMNIEKLKRTLERRKWSSMLASARAQGKSFDSADMARLMDQGLSEDHAWTALVIGEGNPNTASQWHWELDVPGELPRPEDALSPKTPDRAKKS